MINRPGKQFVFINSASIKCIFKAVVYQLEFIVVQVNSAFVIIVFLGTTMPESQLHRLWVNLRFYKTSLVKTTDQNCW